MCSSEGLSWHCTNGRCKSCAHGRSGCTCQCHQPDPQVRIQPGTLAESLTKIEQLKASNTDLLKAWGEEGNRQQEEIERLRGERGMAYDKGIEAAVSILESSLKIACIANGQTVDGIPELCNAIRALKGGKQ